MRRIAIGIGGVVLLAVLVSSFAVGVGAAQASDNGTNASLGAEISSFMQASDTDTANEFDDGMFAAAMNRSTDPEERRALIENRTDRLEERHQELRAQREGLGDKRDVRSRAIATRVAVGSSGLERAANRSEAAAREVGANTDRINELRSSAREVRGSDVVGLTPGVAGPPDENVRGPPEVAPGPSENQSIDEPSTTSEPSANRSGDTVGNGSAGPPDEGKDVERSTASDEGDPRDRSDRSDNESSSGNGEGTGPPTGDGSGASDRSSGGNSPSDRGYGVRPN